MTDEREREHERKFDRRITELEERVRALENVFSSHVLERSDGRSDIGSRDARAELSVGDVKTLTIFDPPGHGTDPNHGIGKINGIVTFVDCRGLDVSKNDVVRCRITNVQQNAAEGVAVGRADHEP